MEAIKNTYLAELDNLGLNSKLKIDKNKAQSYRNNGNYLWRLKGKKFTVRVVDQECYAIRIL